MVTESVTVGHRKCSSLARLADREIGTVTAWLKNHPAIEIVCRDRGGGYREATTHGAPQAVQITDRWHLLENASAAFLDIIRLHMRHLRHAVTRGDIDPKRLSAVEKLRWLGKSGQAG